MMPSSTHGDPQLGIDIHLCFVPFPCPLPSLHLSVVFDPFDYLPFIGATVEIAGMKRTTAGTGGIDIHIPPGFPFAPLFPTWDDETFMGSSTVLADSDPLTYTALPVLGCQVLGMPSPPRMKKRGLRMRLLPTEVNLAIPKTVYVGGSPTISLMGMAMRAGFKLAARGVFAGLGKLAKSRAGQWMGRAFKKGRQKLFKNMKPGFLKCKVFRAEPVNILTGEVSMEQSDFTLPGRIPIEWLRSYASNQRRKGACGIGWETPADGRLEFDLTDGSVIFYYPDDGPAIFSQRPGAEGDEAAVLELMDGALLSDHGDEWRVRTKSDLIYHFPKAMSETAEADLQVVPLGRISDLCGNWLEFQRRGRRLVAIRESAERYLRFDYDDGFISTVTLYVPASDFTHRFISYEYDDTGDLVVVRDALNNPYNFAYDNHHMVQHTNRIGLSFYYEYDKSGDDWRVIHSWGDGGLYDYHFAYWLEIQETRFTDSLGHVTTIKYNDIGLPILEIDPLGGRTIFEYDEAGRTTAVVDPKNHRTVYEYDNRGNLLKLTRPDNSRIIIKVNENNKQTEITDALGAVWRQTWNDQGLLLSQTSPLGSVTRFEYDKSGALACTIDAHEEKTLFGYNATGSLTHIVDTLGNVTNIQYDKLENIQALVEPLGRITRHRYDTNNRLIETILPDSGCIRYSYDAQSNLILYEDEKGASTALEYVGLGLVSKCRHPNGRIVEYLYDSEEQLIGVKNQRGELSALKRDAMGQVIEEVDYWGQSTHYIFDAAGHLVQSRDATGRFIKYKTDELGRVRFRTFESAENPTVSVEESFDCDANGNFTGCKNENICISRKFDLEGRLTEEKQGQFTVRHTYDALGQRIKRETSLGDIVHYSYDRLGQLSTIRVDDEELIAIERNAAGQVLNENLSRNLTRHYSYDDIGRITNQRAWDGSTWKFQTRYEYDLAGNLTERDDSEYGLDRYKYDAMSQVIEHLNPKGRVKQFFQDPAGDRLVTSIIEQPSRKVVGASDQPGEWSRQGAYEGVFYSFDRLGNIQNIKDEHSSEKADRDSRDIVFSWDANKRLEKSVCNGIETTYGYDPVGRRIFKQTENDLIYYGWDGDTLIAEIRETFDKQQIPPKTPDENPLTLVGRSFDNKTEYIYYPGTYRPLAVFDGGKWYHYHSDPNGSPTRLTDTEGRTVWSASYEALGEARIHLDEVENKLRLQGQYFDKETGLHYNRYRYFDPHAGFFVSQDPLGLTAGTNVYQYAPNLNAWTDPLGLIPVGDTNGGKGYSIYQIRDRESGAVKYVGETDDFTRRQAEHTRSGRLHKGVVMEQIDHANTYGEARGYEQAYMEEHKTVDPTQRGKPKGPGSEANRQVSFRKTRTDARATVFNTHYKAKRQMIESLKSKKVGCG